MIRAYSIGITILVGLAELGALALALAALFVWLVGSGDLPA